MAHATNTHPDTATKEPRSHSVGLTQSYEFRDFAFKIAETVMKATGKALQDALARARGLRDAKDVWQSAQDEARVCRGVGKPKGVVARNDPERQKSSKSRKPVIPL